MVSADKDKIKNCELLGGLKNKCHFLRLPTYNRPKFTLYDQDV